MLNQYRLVQVVWHLFPLSKVLGLSLVNGENLWWESSTPYWANSSSTPVKWRIHDQKNNVECSPSQKECLTILNPPNYDKSKMKTMKSTIEILKWTIIEEEKKAPNQEEKNEQQEQNYYTSTNWEISNQAIAKSL